MTDRQSSRVYLDSIGCRLNQSEIENMARQFRRANYELVAAPEDSDIIVLNTCTVTAGADSESRRRLRRYHEAQPEASIVATGCWATLNADSAQQFAGVDRVVPNEDKDDLVASIASTSQPIFDREPVARRPVPGIRMRTRAFIKVQDGCDHHCTYCLTTLARGDSRSLPIRAVIKQVQAAVKGGAQEAVLSGVQLSGYGGDLDPAVDLVDLVQSILQHTDIPRLRLSSLEPWGLPETFLQLWEDPRLCRHAAPNGSPDHARGVQAARRSRP
ncbi:MAG: hypothetical protein R3191_04825 [Anaerolineales bacterium]|nr:hypothetical protein [Anaerolineales bacterium]